MGGSARAHGARGDAGVARSALTGLIAAATLMIGAGLGAVAALAVSPAGASTAHSSLPPVNVSVTNTPAVNVGNFPEKPYNGTWRIQTENGHGNAETSQCWSCWVTNSGTWAVNLTGSGVFKGLVLTGYQDGGPGSGACLGTSVYIDGRQMLGDNIYGASQMGSGSNPVEGGYYWNQNGAQSYAMHFTPPGGLAFHNSLQVWVGIWGCGGSNPVAWRVWWSQTN